MIGSLCSGYGGLDLAVEAVFGQPVAWHCEIEPAPSRGLEAHWPGVPNLRDLTEVAWDTVEPVDILTAGYPCQPFSHAGQRKGADDERHLWPYVAEAVRRIRPRLVVLENVSGHRSLGFDVVLGDLAALRYDVRWASLRAADVGAPHGRERVFLVAAAYADQPRLERRHISRDRTGQRAAGPAGMGTAADATGDGRHERRAEPARLIGGSDAAERGARPVADTDGGRCEVFAQLDGDPAPVATDGNPRGRNADRRPGASWGKYEPAIRRWERVLGRASPPPTEPGPRGGQRLSPLFVEFLMGLPAGWVTDVNGISRNEMLRMLGNGVVPQQAEAALRALTGVAIAA